MKRQLLLLLTALLPLLANAYNAKFDGIYYNFSGDEATVTYYSSSITSNSSAYSGDVVIPSSVTYNGKTYSVTSIGNSAFSNCSGLTSVTIPNSVTSIGNGAFYDCDGLQKVIVPNIAAWCGISFADSYANPLYHAQHIFSDENTEITALVIPESVTSIGQKAFYGCRGLTSVTIPNSVTSIGESAFLNCSNLTSVTIGNSVTSIGEFAFYKCSGLTSITIPNSVTSIGGYAFCNCSGLTSITIPNSVTSIGKSAFEDCSSLTSITIPDSVTSIGEDAFYNCSSLTSVNIPESVTSIGGYAFYYCTSLTSVTIPNSVTSIGNYAFEGCSSLTSVTIPNSVTSIGGHAFYYCTSLTSVTIPNSVTSIGGYAFYGTGWYNAQPDGILYLDNWLIGYKGTKPTGNVTIKSGTRGIADDAFFECSGLTSVTIPNSVTSIGNWTFSRCSGLTSIKVETGNTKYDSRNDCNAIIETETNTLIVGCQNTIIPNGVTSIGEYAFSECSSLTSVTIPNSVTSIGEDAFYNCSSLTSVTIPNSVTSIGEDAFYNCSSLTSVTIPESVTSIGSYAFRGCNIQEVISMIKNPFDIDTNTFSDNTFYNATLYVPEGTIDTYKTTGGWNKFVFIEDGNGGGDTPPEPSKCATPTISYANGKLTFNCETEDVIFHSTITDTDITSYLTQEVELCVTYTISVYATKEDYEDSEVVTGTLCWIDQQPSTEGIVAEDAVTEVKALPVLIQSNSGTITVQGANEGTEIMVYSVNGMKQGSAIATNGFATINTSLQPGSTAIVKIGEKAIKVLIK